MPKHSSCSVVPTITLSKERAILETDGIELKRSVAVVGLENGIVFMDWMIGKKE